MNALRSTVGNAIQRLPAVQLVTEIGRRSADESADRLRSVIHRLMQIMGTS